MAGNEEVLDEEKQLNENANASIRLTKLPQTRVRNIIKLDHDVTLASSEAVYLITKTTELFVEYFTKEAHKRTVEYKRKTLQRKDLDDAIKTTDHFAFLEDIPLD
ncbi:uncharacterized protein TRIADDRAFT_56174 [Trichoplax adhaerens]|uniref:Transcription factor CBF/NF-Y/archaeal histone domain-containing protein n=1 Tax=Trichoplax adhaerens TaxID=10228 RepID=B3RXD9_TRIAD|nr:hypothetical protein TRIADDRAFT_56174 [Trichoplax adhaerens]EDV24848.1 hypothetical protein TRIADDRAFT_56174 [Trichoplax adhaerens]|eukprot:XP_002112738.1 hypothetical protein TRIADDRAFT_56174 [Trichoplax adhaerens]